MSLFYAESMLLELQGAVQQWQVMRESLHQTDDQIRRDAIQRN